MLADLPLVLGQDADGVYVSGDQVSDHVYTEAGPVASCVFFYLED